MKIIVTVKPNSSKGPLVERGKDGNYTVYFRAKPHDGEANAALIELLAKHFQIPKTSIAIIRGATSRYKVIEISQPESRP